MKKLFEPGSTTADMLAEASAINGADFADALQRITVSKKRIQQMITAGRPGAEVDAEAEAATAELGKLIKDKGINPRSLTELCDLLLAIDAIEARFADEETNS